MVLFVMLYKVVLTFEKSFSVTNEIKATGQYFSVLLPYYAVQGGSSF